VDRVLPHEGLAGEDLAPLPEPGGPVDVAVNLHGRGPESHRALLGLRPRRLMAFCHPDVPESAEMPAWRPGEHEVRRWCRLLCEHGVPADAGDLRIPPPPGPPPGGAAGATLLHPGAASPARRWPPPRWAAVARAERSAGREVIVTGSGSETALVDEVVRLAGLPPSAGRAGAGDVLWLARAVSAAGLVVCGDTGVAHLATAMGTPSVVLFGPVSPALWGPPEPSRHLSIWKGRSGDPHGGAPDPGLLDISVDDVLRTVALAGRR
jgi:ADP-heptose:LPS heptosyltransferase